MILYKPPTFWSLLRGTAINVFLPFVNGLMLGLGELLAHEAAFRLGWSGTKVRIACNASLLSVVNQFTDSAIPRFSRLTDALHPLGPESR